MSNSLFHAESYKLPHTTIHLVYIMPKRLAALILICLIFTGIAAIQLVDAAPRTIIVPDNYPSITQAIANAANGDVIYVRNGVYNDSYLEINKTITIRGEDVRNTIVNLTPTVTSVYSSYFNRTYYYPGDGIIINADNVKIAGLTVTSTGGVTGNGDEIQLVSNILTTGKTCSLTGQEGTIERNTLNGDDWRVTGSNFTIKENKINNANHSITVNASSCNIYGNIIPGTLVVYGSMNNISHNSYELMFIFNGDYNTVQDNSGEISLGNSDQSCSNNIVSGNIMKGPSVWGLWIGSTCRNNVIYDNYIVDEGYAPDGWDYNSGVCICNLGGVGLNNTFYRNAFVNNSLNVKFYSDYHTGGNSWDNGSVGNYWSNYIGTDADGDGVGDTPYVINSENRDNHPLASAFKAPTINVEPPVYDPPIDGSLLPQTLTATPTPTPTSSPAPLATNNNQTLQPTENGDAYALLAAPESAIIIVIILASLTVLIVLVAVWRRDKPETPKVN